MSKLPAWIKITFNGRINLLRFLLYNFIYLTIGILILFISYFSFIFGPLDFEGFQIFIQGFVKGVSLIGEITLFTFPPIPIAPAPITLYPFVLVSLLIQEFSISMFISIILFLTGGFYFLICSYSMAVRRLHDLNKNGWWVFLLLIPLIGTLFLMFLMTSKGTDGSNEYGPDPREYENYSDYLKALKNPIADN